MGWPGWWGLEGPEYLAWVGEQPPVTYLMGANTYRLMSSFAGETPPPGTAEMEAEEEASVDELTRAPKVVFSASLEEPLTWVNTTLVHGVAVQAVRAMRKEGSGILSTLGSISLCRSLLKAGLVDRFRVVVFPVGITVAFMSILLTNPRGGLPLWLRLWLRLRGSLMLAGMAHPTGLAYEFARLLNVPTELAHLDGAKVFAPPIGLAQIDLREWITFAQSRDVDKDAGLVFVDAPMMEQVS